MSATYLLRNDDVWLADLLIEAFRTAGGIPQDADDIEEAIGRLHPEIKLAPTDDCWDRAVCIFEEHMNDEAREIVEGLMEPNA